MTYNVNAERARRTEAAGGTHWKFELDDKTWQLPREIPFELAEQADALGDTGDVAVVRRLLELLLGDDAKDFPLSALSVQDLLGLMDAYMAEVSVSLGESEDSPDSSPSTATPSRRTSKPHTKSRSRTSTPAR